MEFTTEIESTFNDEYVISESISTQIFVEHNYIVTTENSLSHYWHILIISVFMILSIAGNGSTIYLESKNVKLHHHKIYVIALAAVDIFAYTIVLPFLPFFDPKTRKPEDILLIKTGFSLIGFAFNANISLLLLISMDRFIAVYYPINYAQKGHRRTYCSIFILVLCLVTVFTLNFKFKQLNDEDCVNKVIDIGIALFTAIVLIAIFIFYILIIIRFIKTRRQVLDRKKTDHKSYGNQVANER